MKENGARDPGQHPASSPASEGGAKVILCSDCGGEHFRLDGAGGVSYAAYGINCSGCTHIEYFGWKPKEASET